MPGLIGRLFSGNRLRARDIVSSTIIVGDSRGLAIAQEPPDPLSVPWEPPSLSGPIGEFDIPKLLTWRVRLVRELVGRDAGRDTLLSWARDDARPIAIRFLSGPGGSGKTRLANEAAEELRNAGWGAGLVSLAGQPRRLPFGKPGAFIVIDYPEEAREATRALLRAVAALDSPGTKIRALLLSRRSFEFWQADVEATGATARCDTQDVALGPLGPAGTVALVGQAVAALAKLAGATAPVLDDGAIAAWYQRDPGLHGLPLFATAAAVHSVLDPAPTFSLAGRDIIRALVSRERRRLDEAARGAGWDVPEAASRLHGFAALRRSLDEKALRGLSQEDLAPGLPPPKSVVDEVARLGWLRGGELPAPQPDLVAAEMLNQTLADRPQAAPDWLAATLADPAALDVERLGRLAHDTATLHAEATSDLTAMLADALNRRPELAETWQPILHSEETSFRLAPLGIAIGRLLLKRSDIEDENRAPLLGNLSNRLGDAGDNAAALDAARDAVVIYRRLAAANPARFEPDLARSLNNLSGRMSAAGDNGAALDASRDAVAIRKRLAAVDPARFESDLAGGLDSLSNRLGAAGDNAAALDAIRDAVAIRKRLAAADPARFEPDLAQGLNNLSVRLSDAGDNAAALHAVRDAVASYRRLAAANPARFEPDLALSLNNLSAFLSNAGDNAAALDAIRDGVDIRRRLAAANPARFEPDLSQSLNNLSAFLSNAGDNAAALDAIRDGVDIRRRLAAANPARFEPDLAQSLNNLSILLSNAGDNAAALDAIRDSVRICRRLAAANPARFEPDLAQSLNNFSILLSNAGDSAAALDAICDAVAIYRRLAAANPARFEPDLAQSLDSASTCLSRAGDNAAALDAIRNAVAIFRRLATANPARFQRYLDAGLRNQAIIEERACSQEAGAKSGSQ